MECLTLKVKTVWEVNSEEAKESSTWEVLAATERQKNKKWKIHIA